MTFANEKLLWWWWCRKLSKIFKDEPRTYLGTVYIKYAASVRGYRPELGIKFSAYFSSHMISYVHAKFVCKESESCAVAFSRAKTVEDVRVTNINFAYHEAEYQLYRVPEVDQDYIDAILDDVENPWEYFTQGLTVREKEALLHNYREGINMRNTALLMDVTYQRVQQLCSSGLEKIRRRLRHHEDFQQLFSN